MKLIYEAPLSEIFTIGVSKTILTGSDPEEFFPVDTNPINLQDYEEEDA